MELRILRYFLAVASEENISRAARQLHITQPTLSRQLHDLETELGVQLFERGSRHITLTPQGLLFRRRAREIIELSDKARQELICGCDDIKGTVAIGAGELQSVLRLGTYMKEFRDLHPQVSFELITATADQIRAQLDQGLLDLGLMIEPLPGQNYEMIRFLDTENYAAVMPASHPLAARICIRPEDLRQVPLILPSRPEVEKNIISWMQGTYEDSQKVLTTNLSFNGIQMVKAGLGVFIGVPVSMSTELPESLELRALQLGLASFSDIVWKPDLPLNRAAEAFIRFLKEKGDL